MRLNQQVELTVWCVYLAIECLFRENIRVYIGSFAKPEERNPRSTEELRIFCLRNFRLCDGRPTVRNGHPTETTVGTLTARSFICASVC